MFTPGSEPHGAAVPARLSSPMGALGYVGHGKGPWDATGVDFCENSVLPPLVRLVSRPADAGSHLPCVQVDSCGAHFGEATSGYIPHVD